MRWLLLLLLALARVGSTRGYDPVHASVQQRCRPASCKGTWASWGSNATLPCSVASGHFPAGLVPVALPLLFEGNFDLCDTFAASHYCRIDVATVVVLTFKGVDVTGGFPLGPFRLDQCLSASCDPVALLAGFVAQAESIADRILRTLGVPEADRVEAEAALAALLAQASVRCVPAAPRALSAGGAATVGVFVAFAACVAVATLADVCLSRRRGLSERPARLVGFFSAKHNGARLLADIPGDFGSFNGLRFFSMCWIITGHGVLFYALPVRNPSAESAVLQSAGFTLIRGAEYSVDSFFFLSGFLAAWGMVGQFRRQALSGATYGMLMLGRYLRLTPTYLFVILLFSLVLPRAGTGPNWELGFSGQEAVCRDNMWANLLYVNNLLPWGDAGTGNSCAGWTWYLANDFQFFALVPGMATLFLRGRAAPRGSAKALLLKYGPCAALVALHVVATFAIMMSALGDHPSSDPRFSDRIYVKPYARVAPYAIGVALAFFHVERVENALEAADAESEEASQGGDSQGGDSQGGDFESGRVGPAAAGAGAGPGPGLPAKRQPAWKRWPMSDGAVLAVQAACVASMGAAVGGYYWQWRCTEGGAECDVWLALYRYGFFVLPNWGKTASALWNSVSIVLWSAPLAVLCYALFCDDRYDVLALKRLLSHPVFTPLARLTYNAYLVHIPIMSLYVAQRHYTPDWNGFRITLEVIGFVVLAYLSSLVLYIVIEKPVMNLVSLLFVRAKQRASGAGVGAGVGAGARVEPGDGGGDGYGVTVNGGDQCHHERLLERQFSAVSDVDNEALHLASPSPELADLAAAAIPEGVSLDSYTQLAAS